MKISESLLVLFCILVISGVSLNVDFYKNTVHPLDITNEHLDGIIGTSDVLQITLHLAEIKQNLAVIMERLPENKNPVWVFPTESTNFLRIENDVDRILRGVHKVSEVPADTSAYHAGMLDINESASMLKENLTDARVFLYGSLTNVFFTFLWLIGATGLTKMWIK